VLLAKLVVRASSGLSSQVAKDMETGKAALEAQSAEVIWDDKPEDPRKDTPPGSPLRAAE
jgi:hypothetical protein